MNFWPGQENPSTLNIIAKHTHTHEVKYIKTAIHELSLWKAFKSFLYPACWILAQLTGRLHELVGWVCSLPHSTAEDCKSPRQVIGCCQFQNLPTGMAWMLLSSKSTHDWTELNWGSIYLKEFLWESNTFYNLLVKKINHIFQDASDLQSSTMFYFLTPPLPVLLSHFCTKEVSPPLHQDEFDLPMHTAKCKP